MYRESGRLSDPCVLIKFQSYIPRPEVQTSEEYNSPKFLFTLFYNVRKMLE